MLPAGENKLLLSGAVAEVFFPAENVRRFSEDTQLVFQLLLVAIIWLQTPNFADTFKISTNISEAKGLRSAPCSG